MSEQTAFIKDVGFGCRDVGQPCLFFSTYIEESVGALQILTGDEALEVIRESGVYDVKDLEGRPCIVDTTQGTMIVFKRLWKKL